MSLAYWQTMVAATQHRPTDEQLLAREAKKLAAQGLTERDVGQALQLDPTAVRRLLEGGAGDRTSSTGQVLQHGGHERASGANLLRNCCDR